MKPTPRCWIPSAEVGSHDAYFWGFLAPHEKAVYFEFSADRSEAKLFEFFPLKWEGDVQNDGASWYASAFADMPFLRHYECIAHLRRYVLAAMVAHERQMTPILKDITRLYRIERRAKKLDLSHDSLSSLFLRQVPPVAACVPEEIEASKRTTPYLALSPPLADSPGEESRERELFWPHA